MGAIAEGRRWETRVPARAANCARAKRSFSRLDCYSWLPLQACQRLTFSKLDLPLLGSSGFSKAVVEKLRHGKQWAISAGFSARWSYCDGVPSAIGYLFCNDYLT